MDCLGGFDRYADSDRVWPQERKYFDSGDYAMSKAGIEKPDAVGSESAL